MPLRAGVCGDPFQHHNNASFYAAMTGLPNQATYNAGANVSFTWDITVNHGGRIGFKICPRRTNLVQSCFDRNPLFRRAAAASRVHVPGRELRTPAATCCRNVLAAADALGRGAAAAADLQS